MSTTTDDTSVAIGTTTYAGWGVAAAGFVGAIVAYFTGGQHAQDITAVESAGVGVISLAITQAGRYLQAHKKIGTVVSTVETDISKVVGTGVANPLIAKIKADLAELEAKLSPTEQKIVTTAENVGKAVVNEVEDPPAITGLDVSTSTVVPQDNSKLAPPLAPVQTSIESSLTTTPTV